MEGLPSIRSEIFSAIINTAAFKLPVTTLGMIDASTIHMRCTNCTLASVVKQLEMLIDQLSQYGQPTTSLVLSIPLTRRFLERR
jgi:hypothetical protein